MSTLTVVLAAVYVSGVVVGATLDARHIGERKLMFFGGPCGWGEWREYDEYDCLKTGLLWPLLMIAGVIGTVVYLVARLPKRIVTHLDKGD